MSITDAAKLPGAFLFLTFTTATDSFAAVAYDENIKKGMKLGDLRNQYFKDYGVKLPYMEKFASLPKDVTSVWQGQNLVSYGVYYRIISSQCNSLNSYTGSIFGGPDPKPHDPKLVTDPTPKPVTGPDSKPATGPDPNLAHLHRISISDPWPYANTDKHPIRHGVYVS